MSSEIHRPARRLDLALLYGCEKRMSRVSATPQRRHVLLVSADGHGVFTASCSATCIPVTKHELSRSLAHYLRNRLPRITFAIGIWHCSALMQYATTRRQLLACNPTRTGEDIVTLDQHRAPITKKPALCIVGRLPTISGAR